MKSAESLAMMFEIVLELKGPIEAKRYISDELFIIVDDILQEQLPVTAEEIDRRLAKSAIDLKECYEGEKKKKSIA